MNVKGLSSARDQLGVSFNNFTTLLYGAIVNQILDDVQDPVEATAILDRLGRYMGCKMVDDYLAHCLVSGSGQQRCSVFRSSCKGVIGALQYFLYARAVLVKESENSYQIKLLDNSLEIAVRRPPQLYGLVYSQVIAGAISGALSQLGWVAQCTITPCDGFWVLDCAKTSDVVELFR